MTIANIHEDIIKTHILPKLDPQTLAITGSTSSRLRSLCSDHRLWSAISTATFPSSTDPLLSSAISAHRSFFSDSFSSPLTTITTTTTQSHHLFSSVDLKYKNQLIFSKAQSTNTSPTDWFQTSPFRIDLLEPKEIVVSNVKMNISTIDHDHVHDLDQGMLQDLEKNVTLSWIVIDPTRNRAVNVSSLCPVSVQRNWLTNDVELTFSAIYTVNDNDYVNCNVQVTCGVDVARGEMSVSGVSLTVLDVYGKCLSGKDSMVILQGLAAGPRRRRGGVKEERGRYEEYMRRRRERNEKTERRERRLDMACVASGVAMLVAFWSFAMC